MCPAWPKPLFSPSERDWRQSGECLDFKLEGQFASCFGADGLHLQLSPGMMRGDGLELKEGRVRLDVRKKFF